MPSHRQPGPRASHVDSRRTFHGTLRGRSVTCSLESWCVLVEGVTARCFAGNANNKVPLRGASRKPTNPETPHIVVPLCAGQPEMEQHASGPRNIVRLAQSDRQNLSKKSCSLRVSGFCQASGALTCLLLWTHFWLQPLSEHLQLQLL